MLRHALSALIIPLAVLCQNGTNLSSGALPRANNATLDPISSLLNNQQEANVTSTGAPACAETDATWLAWSEWSTCSDECGSCGVHLRTRTCLTTVANCACEGDSTSIEYCNLEICRYPRSTCCYNFKVTSYNSRFACLGGNNTLARAFSG